jgi:hypothetical protein
LDRNKYGKEEDDTLDKVKVRQRANKKLDQVDKHMEDSGLREDLHVWLTNERSEADSRQVAVVIKKEAAARGVHVTVGSLTQFMKTKNAAKSLFSVLAAVAAFFSPSEAEAAEPYSRDTVSPLPHDWREVASSLMPDEIQVFLDMGQYVKMLDPIAQQTAQKVIDSCLITGNYKQVEGLPLLINTQTGELFGVTTEAVAPGDRVPGVLEPLGKLGMFLNVFVSADGKFGFIPGADNKMEIRLRVNGEWIRLDQVKK